MSYVYLRFPEGRARALTLSYDDAVQTDVRLIEIMKQHGLKGTFNVNSELFAAEGKVYAPGTVHRRMSRSESLACFSDPEVEVAIHGATHPFWNLLPSAAAVRDIYADREALEKMFGRIIRGAAYPFGAYSDEVVEILRQCGIAYCRTTKATGSFAIPTDWLRLHPTCHHNDERLMPLAEEFLSAEHIRDPLLFYVWGHSYEFDGNDNWQVIEQFAEYIGGRDDIWYATNIEIYDYVQAYRRLVFSADFSQIFNPSTCTVWLRIDRNLYEIRPGETVTVTKA